MDGIGAIINRVNDLDEGLKWNYYALVNDTESEGEWRSTKSGLHFLIKKGETKAQALERKLKEVKNKTKESGFKTSEEKSKEAKISQYQKALKGANKEERQKLLHLIDKLRGDETKEQTKEKGKFKKGIKSKEKTSRKSKLETTEKRIKALKKQPSTEKTEKLLKEAKKRERELILAKYDKKEIQKAKAYLKRFSKLKEGGKTKKALTKAGKGLTKDFMETDFMPFTIVNDYLGGYITRDGPFLYGDQVKWKEWDNLKDIYGSASHMIAYGAKTADSHTEAEDRMIGYFDTFELVPKGTKGPYAVIDKNGNESYIDDKFNRVATRLHPITDIVELTDLSEDDLFELPVSASYEDIGKGSMQYLSKLYHGAVSLNKNERDRCSTLNGSACNMSLIRDFMESVDNEKTEGRVIEDQPRDNIIEDSEINNNLIKNVIPY